MYHMLTGDQQAQIKQIERRALHLMIDDLLGVCADKDRNSEQYNHLKQQINHL